jgi:hypothetical protein
LFSITWIKEEVKIVKVVETAIAQLSNNLIQSTSYKFFGERQVLRPWSCGRVIYGHIRAVIKLLFFLTALGPGRQLGVDATDPLGNSDLRRHRPPPFAPTPTAPRG